MKKKRVVLLSLLIAVIISMTSCVNLNMRNERSYDNSTGAKDFNMQTKADFT